MSNTKKSPWLSVNEESLMLKMNYDLLRPPESVEKALVEFDKQIQHLYTLATGQDEDGHKEDYGE